MKILIVHQYYLGPGDPGGSRFNELAKAWRTAGHEVEVVCGSLNYATGRVPDHLSGKWALRGVEQGIVVWRCFVPRTYNKNYLGRMWAFFGFTLSSLTAAIRVSRPDVIIATSPPLTAAITGWLAAAFHNVPWIFEVRDLWPESAVTTGVLRPNSLLTRALYGLERFACQRSTVVNVLTPAFRDSIVARGLAPVDKISFIPNGADLEAFVPGDRNNRIRFQHRWGSQFVCLYAGAHGQANDLGLLVKTAVRLRAHEDIRIVTVGDGPERERWRTEAASLGLTNLTFLGAVSKNEMPEYVQACDAGLAILQSNPTFRTVYPNKVFDYMACARPTLLAIDGIARSLVCDEAEAGIFVPPGDSEALAAAILTLQSDPAKSQRLGESGRRWAERHASRQMLADRYLKVLSDNTHSRV